MAASFMLLKHLYDCMKAKSMMSSCSLRFLVLVRSLYLPCQSESMQLLVRCLAPDSHAFSAQCTCTCKSLTCPTFNCTLMPGPQGRALSMSTVDLILILCLSGYFAYLDRPQGLVSLDKAKMQHCTVYVVHNVDCCRQKVTPCVTCPLTLYPATQIRPGRSWYA